MFILVRRYVLNFMTDTLGWLTQYIFTSPFSLSTLFQRGWKNKCLLSQCSFPLKVTISTSQLDLQRTFPSSNTEKDKKKTSLLPLLPCFGFRHNTWSYGNYLLTRRQKIQDQKYPKMAEQKNIKRSRVLNIGNNQANTNNQIPPVFFFKYVSKWLY